MPHRLALVPEVTSDRGKLLFDIAFHITLATRRFRARFMERVKGTGQTESRWSALYMLAEAPEGLIQSELAERMGVQGPTLVRVLDALEEQGMVARRDVPHDRRANRLFIEPAGIEMLHKVDLIASGIREKVFAGISEADLITTSRVLDLVTTRLGRGRL